MKRTLLMKVIFLSLATTAYSSIIDQQQVEADGTLSVQGAGRVAQTFTAGISGQLEFLEFGMRTGVFYESNPVYIQIRETQNGAPKDEILAEKLFELTDEVILPYPHDHYWAIGDFRDEAIELTAGQQYAMVVYTTSYTDRLVVSGNHQHPYERGQIWGFTSSANQWAPFIDSWTHEGVDMCFRTTIVPEPGTMLLFGLGGALLRRRESR